MNIGTVLLFAALAGVAFVARRRGAWLIALGFGLASVLPALAMIRSLSWPELTVLGVLLTFGIWHRWSRSSATVTRWSARTRRRAGVASTVDVLRLASRLAVCRKATTLRPSVEGWTRRERLFHMRTVDVAVELCRVGFLKVWATIEDVVFVFGGPRSGKTGWLAGRVLDAPGAVVVTSTRRDLYDLCGPLRAARGPVYAFNAVGLGGIDSTITFDPLTGCADPVIAAERATDMLSATTRASSGDREFWDAQGRRVLAALLHAAALGDRTMRDVLGWVADPERAARELPVLLRLSGEPAFELDAMQFVTTNERTRSSITSTIMPALGWLTSPPAAAAGRRGIPFDVEELIRNRATVFLLGAEETQAAPLVCALTGHIAREARRIAALWPGGRLDPPLTLALDEAALISPVPLQSWTADMGGRGVTIIAAFQSRAQLLARWGEHDAATILNNTGSVMVFGGTRDRDDLQFWSTLTGERDERITTTDLHGRVASRTVRKVPVLAPAQIANLPSGRVMLIRRGLPPVVGRVQMAWKRRDVRRYFRPSKRRERAALWHERFEAFRIWRNELLAPVLGWLAQRWPGRFGATAERVRDANAMFHELRVIHGDTQRDEDTSGRTP